MWQQEMVCFTVILGEGLFRTGPLKHYRTGTLLPDSNNGEGEKRKSHRAYCRTHQGDLMNGRQLKTQEKRSDNCPALCSTDIFHQQCSPMTSKEPLPNPLHRNLMLDFPYTFSTQGRFPFCILSPKRLLNFYEKLKDSLLGPVTFLYHQGEWKSVEKGTGKKWLKTNCKKAGV